MGLQHTGNHNGFAGRMAGVFTAELFTMRARGFLEAEVTLVSSSKLLFKMTG